MISLIHPVSGEDGFFVTMQEKVLIDAILSDFQSKHLVTTSPSRRGVVDE